MNKFELMLLKNKQKRIAEYEAGLRTSPHMNPQEAEEAKHIRRLERDFCLNQLTKRKEVNLERKLNAGA